jgi:hypothetical protein
MTDGLAGRVNGRKPGGPAMPTAEAPVVGPTYWPGATAEQVEFRIEVAFKAYSWLIGEDWGERWGRARCRLRALMEADGEEAQHVALWWVYMLGMDLMGRGVPFAGLLDDREELMRFWRELHRGRKCHLPSKADLSLLAIGDRGWPCAPRSAATAVRIVQAQNSGPRAVYASLVEMMRDSHNPEDALSFLEYPRYTIS